ncbi:MAG: hypothetical protein HC897_09525 [Thermoanaerobaculia bacterium]|nr:hypothetical protein [Thermoanaerobaculia bacterium]
MSAPATGDLDGDGDLDAVVGRSGGTPATFRNTGSATDPVYVLLTGSADPFAGISISLKSLPTLGDVDGDGDLDAVIGGGQVLAFFRNTGSVSTPAFIEVSGSASPFDGIGQAVLQAAPRLADVDDDGDLDLVLGGYSVTYYAEEMFYWENTGSSSAPAYVQRTESQNPFYFGGGFDTETPALGDLDGDGDLDLVLGVEDDDDEPGYWVTFENVGSASAPVFRAIANPFNGFVTTWGLAPTLADLDGDGDVDMLAGQGQGTLTFFESQRAIFSDGFESGDSSAWMATSP